MTYLRSALVSALAGATAEHPLERRLLVARSPGAARELLRALALTGTSWIGWEPASLRQLALELAGPEMAREGVRSADEFDIQRCVDLALDGAATEGGRAARALASPGFRAAAHRAVHALRAAGIRPALLASVTGEVEGALAEVLERYERALAAEGLEDGAGILARGVDALARGPGIPGRVALVPGLERSGVQGALLDALVAAPGVELLPADPAIGLDAPATLLWRDAGAESVLSWLHAPASAPRGARAPEVRWFAAATPADELREVLRRVTDAGVPWDRVEIVTTDAATYGPALDALARRLGIPLSNAAGLSSAGTRAGRAVAGYLAWIGDGFAADRLRALLQGGEIGPPPGSEVSGHALADRLARLRIGWGRERYLPTIDRALAALSPTAGVDDDDGDDDRSSAARRERERAQLGALRELVAPVLAATPAVPDRQRTANVETSPAALAEGLIAFLRLVPPSGEVEAATLAALLRRLERMRATLTRTLRFDDAAAIVQDGSEVRVSSTADGAAGWGSAAGALHLSEVDDGAHSGRPHTFVVGLDADRAAVGGAPDPLLPDALRRRLRGARVALPSATERLAAGRHALAALLARCRGEVTLSYSAWDAAEGRAVSPSAELLQAFRLVRGDPVAGYDLLHDDLGALACSVPGGEAALDGSDVWMRALAAGGVRRDGARVVRDAFPALDRGLRARDARDGAALTPHHGVVPADAARAAIAAMTFSPSRLETLGACPRRFLYRYLLSVHPPDRSEWDAEAWLDPLARGSLLHRVYEDTLTDARARGVAPDDATALTGVASAALERAAAAMRDHLPPPSERVYAAEMEALRVDAAVFAAMVAGDPPAWRALEWAFGAPDREVAVEVDGLRIPLRGTVDRVDDLPGGAMRVVDYKTGGSRRYRETAPFAGGRRIQHWVYQLAVRQVLGAADTTMEYHFPTVRGEKRVVAYPAGGLGRGADALRSLIGMAVAGHFVATDDAADCAYCDFGVACRVREQRFGGVTSPAAAWSRIRAGELPEYLPLAALRGIDAADG